MLVPKMKAIILANSGNTGTMAGLKTVKISKNSHKSGQKLVKKKAAIICQVPVGINARAIHPLHAESEMPRTYTAGK